MKKNILTIIFPAFITINLSAQITTNSLTHSRFSYLPKTKEYIDITLAPSTKTEIPENCVGRLAKCNRSFFNNAEETNVEGGTLWRIGVSAKDAGSIGVDFQGITLSNGVEMCLYGGNDFLGIITDTINNENQNLRTRYIDNDSITIELFVPDNIYQPDFTIAKIAYGFYPISKLLKGHGLFDNTCEQPDINSAAGQKYQVEKHAVVLYQFDEDDGYSYVCTGTLINNTANDATPYLLTAAHCICNQSQAASVVTYFNFELSSDGNSPSPFQTLSGAELIAFPTKTHRWGLRDFAGIRIPENDYNDYDISLLKLNTIPPKSYLPYYMGVSLSTRQNIDTVVTIHHPAGNEKAIAVSNMPPYQDSYPISDEIFNNNSHWHIDTWHLGYTETGSSGAPLLNQEKKIIGVLSGGFADCEEPYDDYYQMIATVWNTNPNPNHQLAYWLANGKENTDIEGFDPYGNFSSTAVAWLSGWWNEDSTAIELEWEDYGNPILYRIYCNNTVIKEINYGESNSYTFTNISPNSTYTFYIESVFENGTETSRSNGTVLANFVNPIPAPDPITAVNNVAEETTAAIYPNPTKNSINILFNKDLEHCTISLYSLSGKKIKSIKANIIAGNPFVLDLTHIKSGIYLLHIDSTATHITQKIVIE